MKAFLRHTLTLFVTLRISDLITLAAAVWFIPHYVPREELGAFPPLTSFTTLLSLPLFALALVTMKESSRLTASGDSALRASLLRGVFSVTGALGLLTLIVSLMILPRYVARLQLPQASVAILAVAAAILGCYVPIISDTLQSLKRFFTLGCIEIAASASRVSAFLLIMPMRPLLGYFTGQLLQPLCRLICSLCALRTILHEHSQRYWTPQRTRQFIYAAALTFLYLAAPMFENFIELDLIRARFSTTESAHFYIFSQMTGFLNYFTYPLILTLFPHVASSAADSHESTKLVRTSIRLTLILGALMLSSYALAGDRLMTLFPNTQSDPYARLRLSLLVITQVTTTCQVFITNSNVALGTYRFLIWFIPLHLIFSLFLILINQGSLTLTTFLILTMLFAVSRFILSILSFNHFFRQPTPSVPL